MVERQKTWLRFIRKNTSAIILLLMTIGVGFIAYKAYNFAKSDLIATIADYTCPGLWQASVLNMCLMKDRNKYTFLDDKRDDRKPWEYWLCADPEENYEIIENSGFQIITKNAHKIPKSGKVVVIANHITQFDPYILMHMLNQNRSDRSTCVMGNWSNQYDLDQAHPDKLFLIETNKRGGRNLVPQGRNKIANILDDERPVIIFPAGDVVNRHFYTGALRFAIDNEAPILLVRISCDMPWWVAPMRIINPRVLNAILLCYTFFNRSVISVTVGDLIPYEELEQYETVTTSEGTKYPPHIMENLRKRIDKIK